MFCVEILMHNVSLTQSFFQGWLTCVTCEHTKELFLLLPLIFDLP